MIHVPKPMHDLLSFLGASYRDSRAFTKAKETVWQHSYPREVLADILEVYNQELGNDSFAIDNARKLALPTSCCVVTGQQLGMMGGPIYTILKGISCLLVAKHTDAVPVFWLATEDHDVAEIDHTYCIYPLGNLKKFQLSLPRDNTFVEDIKLTSKNIEEIKAFWDYLGTDSPVEVKIGDSYSRTMTQVLMRLFAGTGMVFLEPKLLRPLAIPFFKREIKECQEIQEVLKETTKRFEAAGGGAIIRVGEPTNLFLKNQQGKRIKIRWKDDAFVVGSMSYSLDEMLTKIEKEPQSFSCNVAARPVLQNTLLPVIAYVAGPAEASYHCQLKDYHHFHGTAMPVIVPRLSATLIPPYAASILEACQLKPWDNIPHHWMDVMPHLDEGQELMIAEWLKSAHHFFGEDLSLDALERYVKLGARKLVHRICKKRLERKGLSSNGLHLLNNLIHPHHLPQERVLNWWGFQANFQENILQLCLKKFSWDETSDYYLYL
jgi:bacillithiol synthase